MFTGIIEAAVPVLSFERAGSGARLLLEAPGSTLGGPDGGSPGAPPEAFEAGIGDSIAVSGCCLTLVEEKAGEPEGALAFDLSAETLERTWFGEGLRPGRRVNLERSVRLQDRLGGHMVSGHVDGGGEVVAIRDAGDGGRVITFEVSAGLDRYLIEKGSVALDGISLTVVEPRERRFDVALIPLTLEVTSLGDAEVGTRVNVEADLIGKWVEKLLGAQAG